MRYQDWSMQLETMSNCDLVSGAKVSLLMQLGLHCEHHISVLKPSTADRSVKQWPWGLRASHGAGWDCCNEGHPCLGAPAILHCPALRAIWLLRWPQWYGPLQQRGGRRAVLARQVHREGRRKELSVPWSYACGFTFKLFTVGTYLNELAKSIKCLWVLLENVQNR